MPSLNPASSSAPVGRTLAISPFRSFIIDLVHFARQVPSVPVSRSVNLADLDSLRRRVSPRPSWAVIFMKAYGLVARRHAELRRALIAWPWARFYEHPYSICALAMEREWQGETGVVAGLFREPEAQPLVQLQGHLQWYKTSPIWEIGLYRRLIRFSRLPRPLRRFFWWTTLKLSGPTLARRFGTFGQSSYGSLGAESLHPISPISTNLTYGPIDRAGDVTVKIVYDHRVMDGALVARCLGELEKVLHTEIRAELESLAREAAA